MVEEYISRKAAIAVLCDACGNAACPKGMIPRCSYYEKMEYIPAADVRPVVVCANCEHNNHCLTQEFVDDCGKIPLDRNTFFCADGERRSNA